MNRSSKEIESPPIPSIFHANCFFISFSTIQTNQLILKHQWMNEWMNISSTNTHYLVGFGVPSNNTETKRLNSTPKLHFHNFYPSLLSFARCLFLNGVMLQMFPFPFSFWLSDNLLVTSYLFDFTIKWHWVCHCSFLFCVDLSWCCRSVRVLFVGASGCESWIIYFMFGRSIMGHGELPNLARPLRWPNGSLAF